MADDESGGSGSASTTPPMGDLKSLIKESIWELFHEDPTLLHSGGPGCSVLAVFFHVRMCGKKRLARGPSRDPIFDSFVSKREDTEANSQAVSLLSMWKAQQLVS